MKYLVQPLVSYSANAPGNEGAEGRVFTIASEHSSLVLTAREELVWQQVPGGLKGIDAGVDGAVWGVNAANQVYQWTGSSWQQMPGSLKQISVGSASQIWGVAPDDSIWRWNGSGWVQVPGGLKHVSVGADGAVWGVNAADDIYRWTGSTWIKVDGKLKQISVGNRTTVWGVNAADDIWVRQGDHWQQIGGKLKYVSAAADGALWGVNAADEIWRWRGNWEKLSGGLKVVAAGSASNVWGVNAADGIYRNAGAGNGRLVQQIWTEDPRQQWRITPNGDGTFKIANVGTGQVLDVRGSSFDKGADVLIWPWHGGNNQRWRISDLGVSRFRIDAVHSGQSLDVYGGSYEAGGPIIQWPWHGGGNQRWRLAEVRSASVIFDPAATVYEHSNFQGRSLRLGVGSYDIQSLSAVGNDTVSSVRVPTGVRVTLYEHAGFSGRRKSFTGDTGYVGDDFNDITSGVSVEKVVTIYEHGNYGGAASVLGVGRYNISQLGIPNDSLSSLRVPQGMIVTLYEHADFQGAQRVYFEDASFVGAAFNDRVSSIEVQPLGLVIPRNALRYGGQIQLRSVHGKWLVAEDNGGLNANRGAAGPWETFTIERSGPGQHQSHVAYGDVISLRSVHGKYVVAEDNGTANANRGAIGPWEKWIVVRSGAGASDVFVTHGDVLSLRSWKNLYLVAEDNGAANANRAAIGPWEQWTITGCTPPAINSSGGGGVGQRRTLRGRGLQRQRLRDRGLRRRACGAEACGIDAALVGACGPRPPASPSAGPTSRSSALCGAAVTGAGACGAAACGAAACGADACGAAASGSGPAARRPAARRPAARRLAAPMPAARRPAAPRPAARQPGADAGPISSCPVDVCGANVCAVNLCPADACGADACAVDIIPIIPGI
ncbi:MAG: Cys-every-fifth RiPP peptide CefA [Nannocystaceae bacterium]